VAFDSNDSNNDGDEDLPRRCDGSNSSSSNSSDGGGGGAGRIRFSSETAASTWGGAGVKGDTNNNNGVDAAGNPVDAVLSWITSDIGSIALGAVGLVLLLVGPGLLSLGVGGTSISNGNNDPVFNADDMGVSTRVNLLAVLAIGAVLLNGLSQLDVRTALAERVALIGTRATEPVLLGRDGGSGARGGGDNSSLAWVLSSIVAATPANTAVILIHDDDDEDEDNPNNNRPEPRWRPVAYCGIVPFNGGGPSGRLAPPGLRDGSAGATPIMDRFLRESTGESYLPTLQALPGRTEFTGTLLPVNTQAALLLPVPPRAPSSPSSSSSEDEEKRRLLLLGSDRARSFTPRDIAWCQAVVARLQR
jgi:Cofactor assembly of complex C subunit B, CCB2/CCB4